MMTVKDVAARLGVSATTVYGLTSRGKLRCVRVGLGRGSIRYTEAHLAEYLASAESSPPPPPTPLPKPRAREYKSKIDHGF